MKYNGVVISDIHFGAIDSQQLKDELSKIFLNYLYDMKKIDFIVITGDYFDHKLYLNDITSNYAFSFMNNIVKIAKQHKCPIRIIYGTESHEVNQYKIFSTFENDNDLDFKVVYTVQEEELCKDLWVLYLPEEFMYSKKEYYKKFFENKEKYNYIFGHGIIQEVMTNSSIDKKKDNVRKKVPIFTTSELLNICKGQIYFGHYHINTNISDKVFYVGSFTRWQYGEEKPKGFYHTIYDVNKDIYNQTFIENNLSKKYITYIYKISNSEFNLENELIDELNKRDKLTEAINGDYVRYIFNISEDYSKPEFIINILNERYKFNNSVKVKIVNGYVEKKKKVNKERLNEVLSSYPMIFDKSVSLEDKIVYYIKKKQNRDISIDNVKKYLYTKNEVIDS